MFLEIHARLESVGKAEHAEVLRHLGVTMEDFQNEDINWEKEITEALMEEPHSMKRIPAVKAAKTLCEGLREAQVLPSGAPLEVSWVLMCRDEFQTYILLLNGPNIALT